MTMSDATAGMLAPGSLMKRSATSGTHDRIGGGRIVAVKPRPEVMPLVAVTVTGLQNQILAVPTGFEPAISSLTGTYARPLHHGTDLEESALSRSPLAPL
jgi:hypothetical protein